MTQTKLHTLAEAGQSPWLDYIDRSLITSGGLTTYIFRGLRGVTSNPTIFQKAISEGGEYDLQIERLAQAGKSAEEIYEALAIEDSRMAADILRPVFDETEGRDGYFSLEVNPHLAHDQVGTVSDAFRLSRMVARPNVMIKVPATAEGVQAFQQLTEEGVNINVTLIFSQAQYDRIAEAYVTALEKRAASLYRLREIVSVASLFVSRIDSMVDDMLAAYKSHRAQSLLGQIGIANARVVYQRYKHFFQSPRWEHMAGKGARVQRVLFGSTGTKNPAYSDVMYVDNLIGLNTVSTIPPKTLEAFLDHGTVALTLERDLPEAYAQLDELEELGIHLDEVADALLEDGIKKFAEPYDALIQTIEAKRAELVPG
jgi:transaldolase